MSGARCCCGHTFEEHDEGTLMCNVLECRCVLYEQTDLRALSLEIERTTGYDSIPTIECHYGVRVFEEGRYRSTGTYECPNPGCKFRRKDSEAMWEHVHFGPHGRPLGNSITELRGLAESGHTEVPG